MTEAGSDVSEEQIALHVREGLARRRMSRSQLANAAQISLSTLEKGLSGERPFTLATIIRIEEVLGVRLRPVSPSRADATLGAYQRDGVDWLAGSYLTLRPSYERTDAVYAYLTEIAWDDVAGHLAFAESGRRDAPFAQVGAVSMPYQSGHIYLVTNDHGQYRLITLGRPSIAGNMYGLLSTLRVDRGSRLTPVASPIVFLRLGNPKTEAPILGQIASGEPAYAEYRAEIDRVAAEEFAILTQ